MQKVREYLKQILFFIHQHVLILGLAGIGVVVTALLTFSFFKFSSVFVSAPVPQVVEVPEFSPSPTPPPDPLRPYSVLLLGYGGGTHEGGSLTDTMLLVYVVPREQRATLFSIPRDLWVELPTSEAEKKWSKINAAFAIGNDDSKYPDKPEQFSGMGGGGRMAKAVVSEILGIEVDYFAAINFAGFVSAYDSLGDISVYVPVTFDDEFYPIEGLENETCDKSEEDITALTATMSGYKLEQEFTCRYEKLHFDAGLQVMDGETALKFVRSRHSEQHGGDFGRSQRQQALLAAVKNKLFTPAGLLQLIPTALRMTNYVQTDVTPEKIKEIITTHEGLSEYELSTVRLTDDKGDDILKQTYSADGQYILVPTSGQGDWTSVREFFIQEVTKQ
ncbi:MAG: LCP family protein [Pseudomonadales bacterium]|nr:LCP family protein [Candidatus Woesebacteria bacterium]MCB9800629.1 LCP family protein [Pseudomonadales bacterium]